jgi:hypothetical protein
VPVLLKSPPQWAIVGLDFVCLIWPLPCGYVGPPRHSSVIRYFKEYLRRPVHLAVHFEVDRSYRINAHQSNPSVFGLEESRQCYPSG